MVDLALLIIRATFGTLLAGHGGQKLFGWFSGPGPEGTRGMMGSMGLQPAETWGTLAGASEFGGGVLTALGFLNPVGELATMGSMSMATAKVHWGKPIWVTSGGAELPVTNIAIAMALTLAGPGKYSLDNALGTRLPRWIAIPGLAAVAAGIYMALQSSNNASPAQTRESGAQLQAGSEAAHAV